ncbi:hypothetical protein [Dyadobacter sp. CY356]|uniref:hypothetical protein n=1 Tax=Dyadobacter sp. CY356 TaxID=2906442 RepID=UPI001F25ECE4|nr:hypothetical protein [Dyadobacter sp. CY356]MCF0055856.1 hypothetical protein [Dyadobacter sp. CY356]
MNITRERIHKEPVFEESVFINCPFDTQFKKIFHAIIFTIHACDFTPRCALEFAGDQNRLQKITDLIKDCQFGIHDVSHKDGRLNMPLELGLFIGCQKYGTGKQKKKSYLILEGNKYSSKVYLSDLAGQDPMAHEFKVISVIGCVRDWLTSKSNQPDQIAHLPFIMSKYRQFQQQLPHLCAYNNWSVKQLLFPEYSSLASSFIYINF